MDKLGPTYSLRVTDKMHIAIGHMPDTLKKEMNAALRELLAQYCHRLTFNPKEWMEEDRS